MKKLILLSTLSLLAVSCQSHFAPEANNRPAATSTPAATTAPAAENSTPDNSGLYAPLPNALSRITKKPFGIFITPQTSPVQPERFKGFHTGVDFETTPAEQNQDVTVSAICTGPILQKRWASGYGGVVVQGCQLDKQDVTVIYGHLNIDSVHITPQATIKAGDSIGILGKGYSQQTDGERKHLHLGIHKGTSINILGYVQQKSQLSDWLDAAKYLK